MQSRAATVAEYLASLPENRRAAVSAVREVILRNLDKNYREGMSYGMIGYAIPHSVYPPGYHCDPKQPLPFAGLASQKGHMSVYLMCLYGSPQEEKRFRDAWARTGKKLDMGKCCIRFKKLDDLALDVLAETIRRVPAKAYIAHYEKLLGSRSKAAPAKAKSAKPAAKPAARKVAKKSAARKTASKKTTARSG